MTAPPALRSPAIDDDERALWALLGGDVIAEARADARDRLFSLHAGFATGLARRHARMLMGGDVEFGDLRQFAFAGLLEAIDRFDPNRGVPFRGFAAHRITGSIRDGLAHMSDRREQISWRRERQRERTRSLGSGRRAGGAASALDALAEIAVGLAIGFMLEDSGMFQPAAETADRPAIPIASYDSAAWNELVARLAAQIDTLAASQRLVVTRHYLDNMAFEQIASLMALSRGRISQIHREALLHLRKKMVLQGHFKLER